MKTKQKLMKAITGYSEPRPDPEPLNARQFAKCIATSELNTRYIQPHFRLAEGVISHALPSETVNRIFRHFSEAVAGQTTQTYLVTKYYHQDEVLTVTESQTPSTSEHYRASEHYRTSEHKIVYRNDYQVLTHDISTGLTLEYVGENQFVRNSSEFPIRLKYDHERQMIMRVISHPHYRLECESLLIGIKSLQKRLPLMLLDFANIPPLDLDSELLNSHSFRLVVHDGMNREELLGLVETLRDLM